MDVGDSPPPEDLNIILPRKPHMNNYGKTTTVTLPACLRLSLTSTDVLWQAGNAKIQLPACISRLTAQPVTGLAAEWQAGR